MKQQLNHETLLDILELSDIAEADFGQLVDLFQAEEGLAKFAPDGICQIDPRNDDRIIYNSARARRPHDNIPTEETSASAANSEQECAVCQGRTTGVVDVAELSDGFTFINKNLFPALYPTETNGTGEELPETALDISGAAAYGLHLLQWTSSHHDKDWHNMPQADRLVAMKRLAILEKQLLTATADELPALHTWDGQAGRSGFVLIIKNYGRLVGGSLAHGHQQIGFSNVMPRRFRDNWHFEKERGERFSTYLLRENPDKLLIRDYGPVVLLVPYFMRRPFDTMLLVKDASKRYLHQLNEAELTAVAEGWHDAIRTMMWIMPAIGRETAYNVVTHNGPGAGLYFEFLPYTQEIGGFEQLGLFVCQGNPQGTANRIREFLDQ